MTHDEATVAASDIARLAHVGRAAVSNWRRRYDDFPQPVGGTASSPLFRLVEVEAWLARHGKAFRVTPEERLWQRLRATVDDLRLGDAVAFIGALLLYVRREPERGRALATAEDRELGENLTRAIAGSVPELAGPRPDGVDAATVRRVVEIAAAEGHLAAFEFLCERYVDAYSRRLLVTPQDVADLMIELTGIKGGSLLDPGCGLGTLLVTAAGAAHATEVFGQEIAGAPARIAAARLLLRGCRARIAIGDSLREDAFPGLRADAVVCNPPFSERTWGYEELAGDARWEYGLPPRGESELAWVQHCLAHVKPGGYVVIMMPAVAAGRRSGRRIRGNLLRAGALRAVITVTEGAGASKQAPDLWVLRRPVAGERPAFQVLMIDAARDLSIAAPAWAAFRRDPDGSPDLPPGCRAVRVIDLLDDEVDVGPARHLSETVTVGGDYAAIRDRLSGAVTALAEAVPHLAVSAARREVATTTVGELVRTGAVTIRQAPLRMETGAGDRPVLTAADVRAGRGPSGRGTREAESVIVTPGDVVVPAAVGETAAVVVDEDDMPPDGQEVLLGPQLYLFRVDPERIDPYFLAGFLRVAGSTGVARASSASTRIDPRRAPVPRVPLDDQRRYGAAFRELATVESALRETYALGESLVRLGFTGVANGSLHHP
ncbi:N-6 DNA methylase [Thermostaphylospora chromogena]|mgnify:CR=1 FL=1|uniref:N-6 DNA Methylase n=1 Tax=Thermostaphylospora chromogena TaxID=35622 RepID=A0A1H1AUL3_9ACTN|nr:N-6 DNA methylase [Thermostaphylospora chromogena]SDQ43353.1 N-6 DNA Methylase [Thermostaphylospora chromogena]